MSKKEIAVGLVVVAMAFTLNNQWLKAAQIVAGLCVVGIGVFCKRRGNER